MAYLLGIAPRNFAEWNIAPVGKHGREAFYSVKQTIAYGKIKWQSKSSELIKHKERLLKAQAERAERELAELKISLIHTEVVKAVWSNQLSYFKARLQSIAPKLSGILSGIKTKQKVEVKLTEAINEALNELSEYEPSEYKKAKDDPLYGLLSEADQSQA